jgi:hypothetical protein
MVSDKTNDNYQFYRKLTNVLKYLRIYSHELAEHATVIYSRIELALEDAGNESAVRVHLKGIQESAKEVAWLSEKLRDLGKN